MTQPSRALILSDGDLAALIGLAHESERSLAQSDSGKGPVLCPIRVEHARSAVFQRQANAFNAEVVAPVSESVHDADMLLAAGRLAREHGASRVIWTAHAGIPADPESIDLDRAASIADTAMLVERVLEIEHPQSPVVEAPFADLSDRQLADLAIDLGQLPGEVWWIGRGDDAQLRAAERWEGAFEASGVTLRAPAQPTRGVRSRG